MSGLLKAGDARAQAGVHAFASAPASVDASIPDNNAPPAPSPEELRMAALEREIDRLTAELQRAALSAETREKQAFTRGEQAGHANAESREKERLLTLTQAIEAAHDAHSAALEQLEVLALSVAQAALTRIFGERSRYADMVTDALRHQLSLVDRALVTQLRVAPADFADASALAALAAAHPDIPLLADPALSSGDCVIDLQLGRIEAGPGQQWQRLSDLLARMAEAEA